MKRKIELMVACLLGGLMVAAVASGLHTQVQAADVLAPQAPLADPRDVVINEVAWAGTDASSTDEWIELYNTTAATVSLDGWHLVDDDNLDIALSGDIPSHGYYLIERTDDNTVSDIPADWFGSFGLGLHNDGEVLTLTDSLNDVIDTANADGGGWPEGSGSPDYYSMERIDPTAPDTDANWCTNDGITRNGKDANNNDINGTPKAQNSCYQPPAESVADLAIVKTGPVTATPGSVITYHITLSNTGFITATTVRVTDTLPAAVEFVTQTSAFTFSQPGEMLVWEVGSVPTGTLHAITVTAQVTDTASGILTNLVTATTTASETATANNTDSWETTVGTASEAQVLISAVLYDGYQSYDPDEAVQLVNVGTISADLAAWCIDDAASGASYAEFVSGTLQPGQRIWAAHKAVSFTLSFGFSPDYEFVDTDPTVPDLTGSWPGYANDGDEVVLRDDGENVVDTLVYETGVITTTGWSGPAVQPYSVGRAEGQIIYRIPDEATGLPMADTNTAADWIQYTENVTYGRRVLYPGWDLEPLFWPLTATEMATVVVGIAPDNGFDVISQTIAWAQQAISIEVYSLRQPDVITALVQKAQEGVSVTVLLEGQQAGVSHSDPKWQQELWACQEIETAGGQCWFMVHDTDSRIFNRYNFIHAKFLLVDDKWLALGSQNLTLGSLPSDDKSNGTYGSRGVVLATDAPSLVARAAQVFGLDLDPAHHNDLLRWSPALTGTYGPPVITYTPQLTVADYTTTTVYFEAPLVVSGTFDFELLTAPEAALRRSDALLGLVARAGVSDTIYVEQLYEHVDWGDNPADDPNPRLEAYIGAARRGAKVRILLNGGTFGRLGFSNGNTATVAYVNQIARSEGLDLEAAVADPTRYGIHNKMVLVWLHDEGSFSHVGSINGSEGSSKVNRELAIQIRSGEVYAYLKEVFDIDWQWSQPIYLPLVMRRYTAPADYLLISEVNYQGYCEWVEIYNPTAMTITLTGHKVGDAQNPGQYEGLYIFPTREIAPGEVILVAGDATQCNPLYVAVDYEMYGTHPGVPNLTKDSGWGTGEFGLGNAGDEVLLLSPANLPVDVVTYGSGSYPGVVPHGLVQFGDTLERIPANVDTDDCSFDFRPGWSPNSVRFGSP